MIKTLVLLVVLVAVGYLALIRHRGWHVDHYAPAARRAYFTVSLLVGLLVASAITYLLRDEILCPGGAAYHDVIRAETQTGKMGIGIVCLADDGTSSRGFVFVGLCAWLATAIGGFALSSVIWRRLGPPAPPDASAEPAPPFTALTDKQDRRRQRKREQRDRDRGRK